MTLAEDLTKKGYAISDNTVKRLLHQLSYTLQANKKGLEGKVRSSARDKQFQYINTIAKKFIKEGQAVISVDTKKREHIHHYYSKETEGKKMEQEITSEQFTPVGEYNQHQKEGFVAMKTDTCTSDFIVESTKNWWKKIGMFFSQKQQNY